MSEKFSMGGQALLEGVMMNAPHHYAASFRKEDGSIHAVVEESGTELTGWKNWPIIRGCIRMVESFKLSMKVTMLSADVLAGEENKEEEKMSFGDISSILLGVLLAVGIFVVLPVYLSKWLLQPFITTPWLLTLCEGILKIALFLGYMLLISLIPDIGRTFEYHGAEHKVVNCYEKDLALTVENAKQQSRLNRRCGTSYIFLVLVVSIILFMFIPVKTAWARILIKLALLPLMAGVAYEILKLSAKSNSVFIKIFTQPGLWFQKITTKEPDDAQLEIALNSAILILEAEGIAAPEGTPIAFSKQTEMTDTTEEAEQ